MAFFLAISATDLLLNIFNNPPTAKQGLSITTCRAIFPREAQISRMGHRSARANIRLPFMTVLLKLAADSVSGGRVLEVYLPWSLHPPRRRLSCFCFAVSLHHTCLLCRPRQHLFFQRPSC